VKLRQLAHARAGDKGHLLNIAVVAFHMTDYPRLVRTLTADRVAAHLADVARGDAVRYEMPRIGALNFVLSRGPRESVTRTLALDAHGKSLSAAILDMEIPE
jgi:hypothetical protein